METDTDRESIIGAIEIERRSIVSNFLDCICADPFWEARFGRQGGDRAEEDVNDHLDNLIIAIRFDLPESPAHHYHYLQNVLIYRGICTRYLRETIDILQQSLAEALPEEWPLIQPYIASGYSGLAYCDPVSQALVEKEQKLAEAVVKRLAALYVAEAANPTWRALRNREALILISFLADAQEKRSPELLTTHLKWLSTFYARQGFPADFAETLLSSLSKEITQQFVPEQARRLRTIIHKVKMEF